MIVLNNIKSDMSSSISVVDINKSTTTNEYYKELWKEKYTVSLNKKSIAIATNFQKTLLNI